MKAHLLLHLMAASVAIATNVTTITHSQPFDTTLNHLVVDKNTGRVS